MSGYLNAKNAHTNGNLQSSEKLLFEQLDAPKMVQSALSSTTYIDDLYPNSKSRRTLLSAQPNMPLRLETKNTNDDVPQNPVSSSCPQEDQWVSYCSDKFPGFQELYNQRQKLIDIINNTTSARKQTQAMDAFLTLSKKLKKFRIQTHPDRATQNGNPLAPYRNCVSKDMSRLIAMYITWTSSIGLFPGKIPWTACFRSRSFFLLCPHPTIL